VSIERNLVEQLVGESLSDAREINDDPRLRDIVMIVTHLVAAAIYALGEIDNDLWFMIQTINEEVADHALILGEVPDDLQGMDAPEPAEMNPDQVRGRITDQLNAVEDLYEKSTNLSTLDRLVLGIVVKQGKAFVLQLRELNDDECHTTSALRKASSTLGSLLRGLRS
jgi:hypothetical protein